MICSNFCDDQHIKDMCNQWRTLHKIFGGGGIFNMYAFGVHLNYTNLSIIMLGISNSLFNYCNVTITLYGYILVCFLVPLAPKQCKL